LEVEYRERSQRRDEQAQERYDEQRANQEKGDEPRSRRSEAGDLRPRGMAPRLFWLFDRHLMITDRSGPE
jgi:hypothetical protein